MLMSMKLILKETQNFTGISSTQEPRIVWLLLKNGARVFLGNKLGLTPVHSAADKGNYKALQSLLLHEPDCVAIPSKTKQTPLFFAVKNGSVDCGKLLLRNGADTKAQNLRRQRPIKLGTSQDMRFILSPAKVVPFLGNHSSHQKHRVMSKESCKELMDDTFDGYDDYFNECYVNLKKSACQRDFHSTKGKTVRASSLPKKVDMMSFHKLKQQNKKTEWETMGFCMQENQVEG